MWCDRCGEDGHATSECPYGRNNNVTPIVPALGERRGPMHATLEGELQRSNIRVARLNAELKALNARHQAWARWHRRVFWALVLVCVGLFAWAMWLTWRGV